MAFSASVSCSRLRRADTQSPGSAYKHIGIWSYDAPSGRSSAPVLPTYMMSAVYPHASLHKWPPMFCLENSAFTVGVFNIAILLRTLHLTPPLPPIPMLRSPARQAQTISKETSREKKPQHWNGGEGGRWKWTRGHTLFAYGGNADTNKSSHCNIKYSYGSPAGSSARSESCCALSQNGYGGTFLCMDESLKHTLALKAIKYRQACKTNKAAWKPT